MGYISSFIIGSRLEKLTAQEVLDSVSKLPSRFPRVGKAKDLLKKIQAEVGGSSGRYDFGVMTSILLAFGQQIGSLELTAENLKKLPKDKRMETLLESARHTIDQGEDATHLLSALQDEVNAPSSAARPATGQSLAGSNRPPPSIAGSLGQRIQSSLLEAKAYRPSTAAKSIASHASLAESLEAEFRDRVALSKGLPPPSASGSRPPTGCSRPPTGGSRPPTGQLQPQGERAPSGPQLLPPVMDPVSLMPEHIVQGFREEYRAMQAKKREAERAAMAEHPNHTAIQPLSSSSSANGSNIRPPSGKRPDPSAPFSLGTHFVGDTAPVMPAKGRRHVTSRAAASSIGSLLSDVSESRE